MKLSKNTVNLLKNYASINSNLLLKTGNKLATISGQKSIIAEATVEDSFPNDFGIYDLNEFLSALSLFTDPDLTFNDKVVTIKEGTSTIKYYASSPEVLTVPSKSINFPDVDVEFDLSGEVLASILKTASVLRASDVSFIGEGGELKLVVGDKKNATANTYGVALGSTDGNFRVNLKIDNLKFIPGDYTVSISSKKISRFASKSSDLVYFVAVEADSTFA